MKRDGDRSGARSVMDARADIESEARRLWHWSKAQAPSLPVLERLPHYRRRWLRPDPIAAAAVWAVLVPEGMAYASLAGLPPETGRRRRPLHRLVGDARPHRRCAPAGRRPHQVFGILVGLLVAVVWSLLALVFPAYRPRSAVLGRAPGAIDDESVRFRGVKNHPE